jgi:hypothetical protein
MANRPLSGLITEPSARAGKPIWTGCAGLSRMSRMRASGAEFRAAKRENKVALSNWIGREMGINGLAPTRCSTCRSSASTNTSASF